MAVTRLVSAECMVYSEKPLLVKSRTQEVCAICISAHARIHTESAGFEYTAKSIQTTADAINYQL